MPKGRKTKKATKVFLSKEAAQFKGLFSPKYEKWMVTEVELISQNNFGTWSSVEEAAANVDKAIKEIAKTISSAVEPEVKRIIDEHKEDIIADMSENVVAGPNLPQMGPSTPPTTEAVPAAPAKEEAPATLSPTPASKLSKVIKALSANASLTLNEAPEDVYKMKSNIDKMLESAGIREFQAALDNGQYKFTFEDEQSAKVAHDVLDSEGFNVMLDDSGSINRDQKANEEEQLFDEAPQRRGKQAQKEDWGEDRGYSVIFDITIDPEHLDELGEGEAAGMAWDKLEWEAEEELEKLFGEKIKLTEGFDYGSRAEFENWITDLNRLADTIATNDSTGGEGRINLSNGLVAEGFMAVRGHLGRPDEMVDYHNWDEAFGVNEVACAPMKTSKKAQKSRKPWGFFPIEVYDNGGETADRYTVIVDDQYVYTMCNRPNHPQGVNMFAGEMNEMREDLRESSGTPVNINDLPEEVKKAIQYRIGETEDPHLGKKASMSKKLAEAFEEADLYSKFTRSELSDGLSLLTDISMALDHLKTFPDDPYLKNKWSKKLKEAKNEFLALPDSLQQAIFEFQRKVRAHYEQDSDNMIQEDVISLTNEEEQKQVLYGNITASTFEESERKGDNFDSDLSQTEQAIDKALSENEDSLDQPAPNIKERTAQLEEDDSVMYLPEEFGEDIQVGDIVEISEGSGVLSGEQATVVPRSRVKTDGRGIPTNVPGAYQPVNWSKEVAIELPDGSIDLMFINRLRKIGAADKFDSDLTETKKNIDEALRENEDSLDQPKPNIKERTAALELRPVGSNMTEVETDQVVVLFSYSTPVAYMDKASGQCFKTAEKFSTTTSRHINKWLEGRPAEEVDQSQIEGLVQTASAESFSIESMDKEDAEKILSKVVGQAVDLEEFKEETLEEQELEAKLETQEDMKQEVRGVPKEAAFMEPMIEEGTWVTIDGPMGLESVNVDLVDEQEVEQLKQQLEQGKEVSLEGTSLQDYVENNVAWEVDVYPGFSAYLSAPGYLDRTENVVFRDKESAEEYLRETYPEEFEEEGEFEEVE